MTAGLPAGRKLILEYPRPLGREVEFPRLWGPLGREQREQGDQQRPLQARAYGLRCLPADTGICTHPERTA